jgi:hypothetical protein
LLSHTPAHAGKTSCDGFEFPFKRIVFCNIGNPQGIGQKPITWVRQVLSLLDYPQLAAHPLASQIFPADVLARAATLLSEVPGGTGAYSESQVRWHGVLVVLVVVCASWLAVSVGEVGARLCVDLW